MSDNQLKTVAQLQRSPLLRRRSKPETPSLGRVGLAAPGKGATFVTETVFAAHRRKNLSTGVAKGALPSVASATSSSSSPSRARPTRRSLLTPPTASLSRSGDRKESVLTPTASLSRSEDPKESVLARSVYTSRVSYLLTGEVCNVAEAKSKISPVKAGRLDKRQIFFKAMALPFGYTLELLHDFVIAFGNLNATWEGSWNPVSHGQNRVSYPEGMTLGHRLCETRFDAIYWESALDMWCFLLGADPTQYDVKCQATDIPIRPIKDEGMKLNLTYHRPKETTRFGRTLCLPGDYNVLHLMVTGLLRDTDGCKRRVSSLHSNLELNAHLLRLAVLAKFSNTPDDPQMQELESAKEQTIPWRALNDDGTYFTKINARPIDIVQDLIRQIKLVNSAKPNSVVGEKILNQHVINRDRQLRNHQLKQLKIMEYYLLGQFNFEQERQHLKTMKVSLPSAPVATPPRRELTREVKLKRPSTPAVQLEPTKVAVVKQKLGKTVVVHKTKPPFTGRLKPLVLKSVIPTESLLVRQHSETEYFLCLEAAVQTGNESDLSLLLNQPDVLDLTAEQVLALITVAADNPHIIHLLEAIPFST